MADTPFAMPGLGAGISDLVSTIKGAVQNLSQINQTLQDALPRITGTFTLSAGTTTVVTQTAIAANGIVHWDATNATAALTVRTAGLYLSAVTSGASFSVSTQSGTAAGTETFNYIAINPA